jgi:DNA invertase Pin-like site-specific DNA recombinase
MTIYGYAQVSNGQTLDCQHAALKGAGCQIICSEKTSDAKRHTSQLTKLLKTVGEGDTVIITTPRQAGNEYTRVAQHAR